jgi:hypothetical protein
MGYWQDKAIENILKKEVKVVNIKELTDYALQNGGATFKALSPESFELVSHSDGYQVALTDNKSDGIVTALKSLFSKTQNDLHVFRSGTFGLWSDRADWYLDQCLHLSDLRDAHTVAYSHRQHYIWDWANNTAIETEKV